MLTNYLKIALRNLRKHRGYAFINVAGLAVGIACCVLIALFIRDEFSYDRHHEQADQIYRLALDIDLSDGVLRLARSSPPMAPALLEAFPEIIEAVRLRSMGTLLVSQQDHQFYEERFYFADVNVFEVFTMPLLRGNPQTALQTPFSVVLTAETARRYFGETDPMGQTVRLANQVDLTVTGVLAPIPSQSHFRPDFLASFASLQSFGGTNLERWGWLGTLTYLLLPEGYDPASLEAKLPAWINTHRGDGQSDTWHFYLQPVTAIHLNSELTGELGPNSDIRYSYLLSLIGLFILLIACINYMNLATARATQRAKEVGMRKILGAHRYQLVRQFLGESMLFAVLALFLALALADLLLPVFNTLTAKDLTLSLHDRLFVLLALLGIGLVVGLGAGSYPALFLTRFQPADTLKGHARTRPSGMRLRQGLVATQFTLSILLVIGTLTVAHQQAYMQAKELGFNKEQVVVIPMQDETSPARYAMIKQALLQHPSVVSTTAASSLPGRGHDELTFRPEGFTDDQNPSLAIFFVDHDFVETLDIKMIEGRDFSRDFATDTSAFLINEAAVKRLGWDDPLGKYIGDDSGAPIGTVVGVIQDFHFESLHAEIAPLLLQIAPGSAREIAVRVRPENLSEVLAFLKQQWQAFEPAYPFQYNFLDDDFDQLYRAEQRLNQIFGYASFLAIFIACLGLFGLAAFTAQQRTKEIGIRKVLGASFTEIVLLLSKDFARLVLVAFILATPPAYFAMRRWLDSFAYRIDLSWEIFLLAGLTTLGVALMTVSYQAVRAALADPVESLRYE